MLKTRKSRNTFLVCSSSMTFEPKIRWSNLVGFLLFLILRTPLFVYYQIVEKNLSLIQRISLKWANTTKHSKKIIEMTPCYSKRIISQISHSNNPNKHSKYKLTKFPTRWKIFHSNPSSISQVMSRSIEHRSTPPTSWTLHSIFYPNPCLGRLLVNTVDKSYI